MTKQKCCKLCKIYSPEKGSQYCFRCRQKGAILGYCKRCFSRPIFSKETFLEYLKQKCLEVDPEEEEYYFERCKKFLKHAGITIVFLEGCHICSPSLEGYKVELITD